MKKQYVFSGEDVAEILVSYLVKVESLPGGTPFNAIIESYKEDDGAIRFRFVVEVLPQPAEKGQP